ncbi:hypothetical protein EV690_0105 [Celerinatantimonas diazotrophica]|uniref:Uncharacterized protein n=1 Tax=Celerinatantimonas diazotrophica TaxID=412034 RepID=A0A4R1KGN1_9GAMM|nr:hypothetical protein EV690_0105 [Celerinatantimonas diazotrophica]CAG9297076.1 hypothetical protein CEDIAZO_02238 [Celerinatantimonas diazotrophica]
MQRKSAHLMLIDKLPELVGFLDSSAAEIDYYFS